MLLLCYIIVYRKPHRITINWRKELRVISIREVLGLRLIIIKKYERMLLECPILDPFYEEAWSWSIMFCFSTCPSTTILLVKRNLFLRWFFLINTNIGLRDGIIQGIRTRSKPCFHICHCIAVVLAGIRCIHQFYSGYIFLYTPNKNSPCYVLFLFNKLARVCWWDMDLSPSSIGYVFNNVSWTSRHHFKFRWALRIVTFLVAQIKIKV